MLVDADGVIERPYRVLFCANGCRVEWYAKTILCERGAEVLRDARTHEVVTRGEPASVAARLQSLEAKIERGDSK